MSPPFDETSKVQWGRTTIEYAIRRSPRRKTVAIAVDPIEGVLLTAPPGIDIARLDRVVADKARWIVERLRLVHEGELPAEPRRFVSGESFAYLGRHHRLRVRPCAKPKPVRLERGWLVCDVPRGLDQAAQSSTVAAAVREWYLRRAAERLPERVDVWAARAGVDVAGVVVKDQQKRWGSCDDKGVVRFNWQIMQAPMRLVDYVVAHELVHLVHSDHTKAFWARLGVLMPDYERRKDELRRLGPRLAW